MRNNRIEFIDIARGFAVIFMIMIHVQMVFSNVDVNNSILGSINEITGGPLAAPVFMFLMGFSFIFSTSDNLWSKLKRGITVLFSGYLLNFLRLFLPVLIHRTILNGISNYEIVSNNITYFSLLTIGDILQFAGIAMIILAILKSKNTAIWLYPVLSVIISLFSPYLWSIEVNIPVIKHILDLLWGDYPLGEILENQINFPVFPWVVFPLMGNFFGIIYKRSNDHKKLIKQFLITGVCLVITSVPILLNDFYYYFNDYYHARFAAIWLMVGIILIWLFICYMIGRNTIINGVLKKALLFLSKNVNHIYKLQWILISWTAFFIPVGSLGMIKSLILMLIIIILSALITFLYNFKSIKLNTCKDKNI